MVGLMSKHRQCLLWVAAVVVVGCNAYDSSLLGNGLDPLDTAGAAGSARPPQGNAGADAMGEGGAPAEVSGGGARVDTGATAGVAGQPGQPTAGKGSGGSSESAGSGSGGSSAGGAGGAGGTAGKGGSSGTGGSAGNAASGGSSAGGGASGSAGSGGAGPSGCALLSVPLKAKTDFAHYLITLDSDTDLSTATLSAHVYAPNATGGRIYLYVQQGTFEYYAQAARVLSGLGDWVTISWDLSSATPSGFDKAKVRRIGVGVDGGGSSAWANPTLVYVDSFAISLPVLGFPLDSSSSVYTTGTTQHLSDTAMWFNNGPSDTTATGAKISWSATCK